jgi:hypothetical protein
MKLSLCLFFSTPIAPIKYIWSLYIPEYTFKYRPVLLYQQRPFSLSHITSIEARGLADAFLVI